MNFYCLILTVHLYSVIFLPSYNHIERDKRYIFFRNKSYRPIYLNFGYVWLYRRLFQKANSVQVVLIWHKLAIDRAPAIDVFFLGFRIVIKVFSRPER